MSKKRPSITGADLKSFRHAVSVLKSKGLTSKRVDARSQKPTRYMQAKVRKLAPVLTGDAVGIKLKPDVLKQYRDAGGFNIVNNRLVLPKAQAEQPGIRRGLPLLRRPLANGSIERIPLPIGAENMFEVIQNMRDNPARWNAMKEPEPQEYFSFTVFGHFSREAFGDVEFMADALENYDPSVFKGFEIVRTNIEWKRPQFKEKRTNTKTVQDRRNATARIQTWEDYTERRKQWDRKYRKRIAENPELLQRKRDLERARAINYRQNLKARKKDD